MTVSFSLYSYLRFAAGRLSDIIIETGAGIDKLKKIREILEDKKTRDIVILDVRKLTWITDYLVIASGETNIQTRAIAEAIIERFDKPPFSIEGFETNWIILDYGDIVIHIFLPDVREFYNLERLWGDAERISP
ncbi:MAG: ribosome silencing factor [Candidatus Omnitrophica bacterium]|nr:ribosome silencing factor [Candidatus Omnitrophota bacterium]MCM8829277.1 ribosome silencing factor [Candidatus Omnitrophota bacterium]